MSHFALLEVNPDGSDPTTWLEPVDRPVHRRRRSPTHTPALMHHSHRSAHHEGLRP